MRQKKFSTEAAWDVVNKAMQVMGGIGYTNVFPIERYMRDIRLMMIFTGTNEVMSLMIQHEFYAEVLDRRRGERDTEKDAHASADVEEKCT